MGKLFIFLFAALFIISSSNAQVIDGFEENFDNNNNAWAESDGDNSSCKIADGRYTIAHKREEKSWLFYKDVYLDPNKDFYIEAKLTQLSGVDNNGYGIVFGMADTKNSYNYVVSSNGMYSLYGFKNNEYIDLKDWASDDVINPMGTANVLTVKKSGKTLSFYINGKQMFTQTYTKFFGLAVGFVLNWKMKVAVDYIKVKQSYSLNVVKNTNTKYKKENLGPNVNSTYEEVGPVISQDGKTLYIDRKDHPENTADDENDDIWVTHNKGGTWEKVQNVGKPLNNDGHNFVFSLSPDENTMLVANTYTETGEADGSGVSITHRTATGWEVPHKQIIEDYYNDADEVSFNLSADRKALIMSVQRSDTYGEHDLYVSFLKKNGTWSAPKNLGPVVNSLGDEVTPYLASDNVTLYYSTSGKPGFGNNDIFVTKRLDNSWAKWSEPLNLGPDINSTDWDAYYSVPASGEYAYFVSSHQSIGNDDIFRIKLVEEIKPEPVVIIYGKVLNKDNNQPLEATITYHDLNTNQELGIARTNPKDGSYKIVLPYGKAYGFRADKEGYYSESSSADLTQIKDFTEIERNLLLAPIQVGKQIALNNVFFVQGQSALLPTSYPELDKLTDILIANPNIKIEISGHTDNVGDPAKNQKLSEDRVEIIKKYLVKKGISIKRLSGKGYGGTKPIASNATEETRKLNRRVEFTIVSK